MSFQPVQSDLPIRQLSVFRAEAFRAVHGVNEGDALTDASELLHEDVYALDEAAQTVRLGLATDETAVVRVAADSAAGRPGAPVHLDSLLTFMGPTGETREAFVFVEVDAASGTIAQVYLQPLAALDPKTGYTLVTIERENARARLAATATVAFTRGTHITMADGQQLPIEDIRPGDKVLTRDSGPQSVRWTGVQTLRASGAFAPITIAPGTLNNTRKLVVSPNHRLFIYQRVDALGAGRKEILVKAGLLVNGTSVTQESGGFVDYFQILFDKHEIIYAEGIAAESLFVDTTTRPVLPVEVAQRLKDAPGPHRLPGHELGEAELAHRKNPVDILKRISAF
jgi:hypothetical protein